MTSSATAPAEIRAGVVYPLRVFMELTGMGRHAMRAARRNGLRVTYCGNRCYIRGESFREYLDKLDLDKLDVSGQQS
jgi:hypothetical protein